MTETKNAEALKASTSLAEYRAAGGEPHSGKNWRILEKLVEREVVQCVSGLVHHFASNEGALVGSDYSYDDILDLCRNMDYEQAATEAGWEQYKDKFGATCYRDSNDDMTWAGGSWQDLCSEFDIDLEPGEQEVYEHWIVSQWFAEKLQEQGETTGELFNLTIWGRCTTGQAISIDHVISEIAAGMQILEGQKYEWTE
jgi:hypothetical protein